MSQSVRNDHTRRAVMTPFDCPSETGPGRCENHAPHVAPKGCVHWSSYVPDRHDRNEGTDEE